MRSAFFFTLVFSVASVFTQQPFVRYSENLRKAVPSHYIHDQKNANRGVDQVPRRHKVEPRQPLLQPQPAVPWLRWVHEGRWAAQADRNTELHKVRARLLEQKLKPNQYVFKPHINPQLKPKLRNKENVRIKRETGITKSETLHVETEVKENLRRKRSAIMSQPEPEIMKQSDVEGDIPRPNHQFASEAGETKKREKRQILYFINRPPQLLARSPRTTPNPFVRDTHIDDYDIIRPEVGEREGMIPTVESGSSDPGSYPLVNEGSTEFSKIISQFYLTTSDEHWPEIHRFAQNILKPLSRLTAKKDELLEALKSVKDINESVKTAVDSTNVVEYYRKSSINPDVDGTIRNRVKRRVNKTLKRKRAKKKKERLRRFEAKRLRMLTHARRVRRQQKAKQARLQRHYARMNMSTSAKPEHLGNQTLIDEDEGRSEEQSESKDDEEYEEETDKEEEEYESSEYEDESESDSKDESNGKTSRSSHEDSEEPDESNESDDSDENETEQSEVGGKPDYGNDDYEEYEDESDDYEDDEKSEQVSEKKKKQSGKEKRFKAVVKNGRRHTFQMSSRRQYNPGTQNQGNKPKKTTVNGENPHLFNGNRRAKTKVGNKMKNDYKFTGNIQPPSRRKQYLPSYI